MALFDDRRFLLSHINHSFITGDDTGICEVVMLDEDVFANQHQRCLKLEGQNDENPDERLDPSDDIPCTYAAYDLDYESELFESEQGQSYDIASDLDYICHRRRSNTAQRLDRLKKDKINQSRTRTIVWRCESPTNSQSDERRSSEDSPTPTGETKTPTNQTDCNQLSRRARSPPSKSGLTRLLEKYPSLPRNPFNEYAQFDGGMSEAVPVKKIMIFIAIDQKQDSDNKLDGAQQPHDPTQTNALTKNNNIDHGLVSTANDQPDGAIISQPAINQPAQSKPKNTGPLEVVIVSTARVQDLIGLICWQYTNENREPKLHHDVNRYCLRIAEDNGEVDPDFTSLNPIEPLSKFNFPSLALTEKSEERIRTFTDHYANGNLCNHRLPSIARDAITNGAKISYASGKLALLTKMFFKDAKLDANQ